jgi:hypothetical protein
MNSDSDKVANRLDRSRHYLQLKARAIPSPYEQEQDLYNFAACRRESKNFMRYALIAVCIWGVMAFLLVVIMAILPIHFLPGLANWKPEWRILLPVWPLSATLSLVLVILCRHYLPYVRRMKEFLKKKDL